MGAFGFPEGRKTEAGGEFLGVAGIDARDERAQGVIDEFMAEVGADEIGEADVVGARAAAGEQIGDETEFGGGGKKRGCEEGRRGGGDGERAAVADNVTVFGGGRGVEGCQAQFGEEAGDLGGELDGIGAGFEEPTGGIAFGADVAAEARGGFEEADGMPLAGQMIGRGESGDAASDDGDGEFLG